MQQAAVAVVGGGILGLATAYHLTSVPQTAALSCSRKKTA